MLNMRIFRESREKKILTKDGFTLIEVLVVVAVSAVIATGGFVMFSGYQKNQNIKLTLSELTATIRDIQKRSVTQENGKQWGIRLSNGVAGSFQTWSGLSYASGTPDQTYSLKRNIQFGNPPSGFTTDLIFQAMTGILGEDRIITVNSGVGALVGDVIMNTRGKVTTRIEKGLVGYWHFDEGTSTVAYDASGNGNNGTLTNGPTWQSGTNCKMGECLNFSNSYISVPNVTQLQPQKISISLWVKFNSFADTWELSNNRNPFDYNYGYMIREDTPSNTVGFFIGYGTSNASIWSGIITTGVWYHLVGTYDGSVLRFYINGNQIGSGVTVNQSIDYTGVLNTLYLGQRSDNALRLNGLMDEIRIYDRALSAQEVLDIYNDLK